MKKPRLSILVVVTLLFAAFTAGFFLGRHGKRGRVELSVPAATQTLPPETFANDTTAAEIYTVVYPIDINNADAETLAALPGIGAVLAERIVAYRSENGDFAAVESLMNVEGIGEKRMEAILGLITVGGTK